MTSTPAFGPPPTSTYLSAPVQRLTRAPPPAGNPILTVAPDPRVTEANVVPLRVTVPTVPLKLNPEENTRLSFAPVIRLRSIADSMPSLSVNVWNAVRLFPNTSVADTRIASGPPGGTGTVACQRNVICPVCAIGYALMPLTVTCRV